MIPCPDGNDPVFCHGCSNARELFGAKARVKELEHELKHHRHQTVTLKESCVVCEALRTREAADARVKELETALRWVLKTSAELETALRWVLKTSAFPLPRDVKTLRALLAACHADARRALQGNTDTGGET